MKTNGDDMAETMTKREKFAAMAMQGFLSADEALNIDHIDLAEWSVQQADELILALNKQDIE
jgi:hypothetical protein